MSESRGGRIRTRRDVVRRRRRERQVILFGLLLIVIAAVAVGALAVYRGDAEGPFNASFTTPLEDFESDITLVCPPAGTKPLDPGVVAVRVMNGTDTNGLAGSVSDMLEGRGFTMIESTNWSRGAYSGAERIMFGSDGIVQAYTVARHFTDAELVLDERTGTTVDVVLGTEYDAGTSVRSETAAELNPDLDLYTDDPCLPWTQVPAEVAPGSIPENPLASVTGSPEPSPSTGE